MKRFLSRSFILLSSILLFAHLTSSSQSLTGIWRGYFISTGGIQYKFELQIEQSENNSISGVSYSYQSTNFYGKATLTGNYNVASKNALIQEIKTVELRMTGASVACIMKCQMQWVVSGKEQFLEGTFTSKMEKGGGDCGGGTIQLRKVPSSDFYVEPFLRDKPSSFLQPRNDSPKITTVTPLPKSNSVSKNKPVIKKLPPKNNTARTTTGVVRPNNNTATKNNNNKTVKIVPHPANKPVVKNNNLPKNNINSKTAVATPLKAKSDTVAKINSSLTDAPVKDLAKKTVINKPAVLKTRENELVKTLFVNTEDITLKIYDNGEIDDDTVSVYVDNKLVLSKKRISTAPLVVNVKLSEDDAEHEVVMVADNLGRIPPNTSLMIVYAGEKRYEVRITSTLQKNAVVRFVYQKSGQGNGD